MKNTQEDKLSMYLSIKNFLMKYADLLKTLPNFEKYFEEFLRLILLITGIAEKQKADRSGLIKVKKELKAKITDQTIETSLKINAYASDSNDTKLKSKAKITRSKLGKVPDTALRDYAKIIYDIAQENLTALAEYGINEATQVIFLETINSYFESISGPRDGKTEKMEATAGLADLLEKADEMLGKMDERIGMIKLSQPAFYENYLSAKKVVPTGKKALALRGSVTDLKNGATIKGVKFSFKLNGDGLGGALENTEIIKKTTNKGNFFIKSMVAGNYKVTVSKPGYKDKEVSIIVVDGERSELAVELEKA
jgi:Carboxypeptidase regulatory-like domain